MTCREAEALLGAYMDDELDLGRSLEVESHLESCASCAAELSRQRALAAAVRERAPYYTAPQSLRKRAPVARSRWSSPWVAGLAAAACLVMGFGLWTRPSPVAREVVADHLRSLEANHLIDVPSSDRHTVKPWFTGKLDYAPDVEPPEGFELMGGRLDYLGGRSVAALIYRRRQHTINVFVWPSNSGDESPRVSTLDGFHLVRWVRGGMERWAVSDLSADELKLLAR